MCEETHLEEGKCVQRENTTKETTNTIISCEKGFFVENNTCKSCSEKHGVHCKECTEERCYLCSEGVVGEEGECYDGCLEVEKGRCLCGENKTFNGKECVSFPPSCTEVENKQCV